MDAYPGQVFKGIVTSIRKAPINVQNVITYDAVIGVSNPDLKLFPGMTANVKILVDQRQGVLKVPNAALRYHPADATPRRAAAGGGGKGGSRTRRSGSRRRRSGCWTARARNRGRAGDDGETDGTFTEITAADLKDGDRAIVAAFSKSAGAAASSASAVQRRGGGTGGGRRGGV